MSHPAEGEWQKIAPLRILSFDIECQGRKGVFPEATRDPVIQIANMVVIQGEKDPFIRNVFTLDTCATIVGSEVIAFNKLRENKMLQVGVLRTHPHSLTHTHAGMERICTKSGSGHYHRIQHCEL